MPLFSGVIYVVGAMLLKRAGDLGVDVWRTVRACNYAMAMLAVPLLFLGGTFPPVTEWWQPAATACLFFLAQILSLLALKIGDVSVATPVLGVKIPLVALFTTLLLGQHISAGLWTAVILSSLAIALLNFSPSQPHHRVGATVLFASLAAMGYALFDVLVQKWAQTWSLGRFLPIVMGFVALYSLFLRPDLLQERPVRKLPGPHSDRWLIAGAICLSFQASVFVFCVAFFQQATVSNVMYSSRGLWSVLAVSWIGHWFDNRERHHSASVMGWRLAGAAFMMTAIFMVFLSKTKGL